MTDRIVSDAIEIVDRHSRLDANETAFLERQLTQLRSKEFDVKYSANIARTLIPKATDIASSTSTYSYKVYDVKGQAAVNGKASDDAPRVDVEATELFGKVVPIRAAYGWSIDEMREAARTRVPLSNKKQMAAFNAVERAIDGMLHTGTTKRGAGLTTTGISNASGVQTVNLVDWDDSTDAAVIVDDLNKLMNAVMVESDQIFQVTTIALPLDKYAIANSKPVGIDNQMTVLASWRASHPGVQVVPWYKLTQAIAYQNDSSVLEAVIPQEFESLAAQERNYEVVINCQARCGGVKVYYPDAMRYGNFSL